MKLAWLARKILGRIGLAWVVVTIVFLSLRIVPGDPAELLLSGGGILPDPLAITELREKLGLEEPLAVQYREFLFGLLHGDLGNSLVDDYPVSREIRLRLPRTLELIAAAAVLSLLVGVPAGAYAALHRGGIFDRIVSWISALLIAVPVFAIGTLLVLLFSRMMKIMPAGGFVEFSQDPAQHLKLLILPALAIASGLTVVLYRTMRGAVLEALAYDYVRTARAKGASSRRVIVIHVLRNALNPVVTVLGLQIGTLIGGTVLVEFVFNWPGISTPLLRAVESRDYPMVVGIVLTISVLALAINFLVEVIHGLLDPRVTDA